MSQVRTSEKAREILLELAEKFGKTEFVDSSAKLLIDARAFAKPSSSWSLGNQLAMYFHDTLDARGYNQWYKVGRYVKKGAKAIYILGPMTRKIKPEKDEEERTIITGFRAIPVFRFEDTEGEPLKEYKPEKLPPLYGLAEKNGITVQYTDSSHGEYGSICIPEKHMTLSTESPDTFLHELMHLYDDKRMKLKPGQDPIQETVAQLGACVLAKMYGYDVAAHTWNYIAAYTGSKDPKVVGNMCFKVLQRVQLAINKILDDAKELDIDTNEIKPIVAK